jgi:hypothetical protein
MVNMKTLLLILSIFFCSCQSIHFAGRNGKDLNLSENNSAINHTFNNNTIDSTPYTSSSIWQRLSNKTYKSEYLLHTTVELTMLDKKHIRASLFLGEKTLEERILKGRFKRGYFALNNRLKTAFTAGPLLWEFAGFKIYLGVTKENNLILFETNAGSTAVLILPIFWAGTVDHIEYELR